MADEGIRSQNQMRGITNDGELRNIRTDDNGNLKVTMSGGLGEAQTDDDGNLKVATENLPTDNNGNIKVSIVNEEIKTTSDKEIVLASAVATIGTTASTISVNGNVTNIMIANYSEEANVTLTIGQKTIVIGSNIATDIPVNEEVTSIGIVASAADTKVYYVIKGKE